LLVAHSSQLAAQTMLQLLGHLHPVLVHLPIGILLLACLFLWQSRKDRFAHLQPAINIILLLGMISAILSCITGFILSQTGDYDEDTVSLHQWMGISVAIVSIIVFYCRRKTSLHKWQLPLALLLVALIFITGHLGGSLTHGSDYLTEPLQNLLSNDSTVTVKRKPIANVQEALVYADLVQPIFQGKCYSCHGKTKQKGKLRLDDSVAILKGGKDGVVLVSGKSGESELAKRITLPREEEHHMAPKEKTQLTEQEIALIKWWIDNGTSFSKKVKQLPQTEKIKSALITLQNNNAEKKEDLNIPKAPVEKADEAAIQKLKNIGAVIIPVAQDNNYLSANFVTANISDRDISMLLPLKKQLIWLNLNNAHIGDSALAILAQCLNLTKLELSHTGITNKGLPYLKDLKQLRLLNLVSTKITSAGVLQLKEVNSLQVIYLYQTKINKTDWAEIKKAFPKTAIDSGGYNVPFLPEDTMIMKQPLIKK
jgi:uncharacterized membrane protein